MANLLRLGRKKKRVSFVLLSTFRNFAVRMSRQRIEYIDAMRGFTMILVVYSHVCGMCLGDKWMGWNDVFFLFRLPCFFFISGWLFDSRRRPVADTIWHKFKVQIIPTLIFLLLLAPPPLFFSKLGATKGGYWFTFALFEFFLLSIFSDRYLKKWGGAFALVLSIAAFGYDIYYNRYFKDLGLITNLLGFLSFMTWRYYLFFYIGTWVRRHFDIFLQWTGKPVVIAFVMIGFVCVSMIPHSDLALSEYLIFAIGGILGMTMIFHLFRLSASYLNREHLMGRCLQYIGTRTLDIYLLHYFFLPRFLLPYGEQLRAIECKPVECLVALSLALLVVAACLAVSYVLRLSPFLGHWLFGVKYEERKTV